ncbi:uncharacterized protein [Onthophagus taurus]|uniref:uncharacterized protein isoform X1 n=1 Tax=Onthophagus taurus TaxID=166361 RepID=UPI000C203D23|nr:uncharacterized protein LOC111417773 isoform X1 [Onthophagus taurus]
MTTKKPILFSYFLFLLVFHGSLNQEINDSSFFNDTINNITDESLSVVRTGLNVFDTTLTTVVNGAMTVTDRIRKLLEEFRKYMVTGIPELGLPILDPLTIRKIDINITHKELSLQGYVEDVRVRHLSKFRLDDLNYDMPTKKLVLNLTFPNLDIDGFYDITINVGQSFTIFGKGPFWIKLYQLSIETLSDIRVDPMSYPPFYVASMYLHPKLKKIKNHFYGLMDKQDLEDTFNKAITRMAPTALDTLWPEIEPKVSNILTSVINRKLQDFRVSRVFGRLFDMFKLNFNQGRIEVSNIH